MTGRAEAWGRGYATEACAAALDWLAGALPGEPVVLYTRTERPLGAPRGTGVTTAPAPTRP